MQKLNIDLLLFGGFPFPAPPIKNPPRLIPAVPYNGVYNILNFPVGILPITKESQEDQVERNYLIMFDFKSYFLLFLNLFQTKSKPRQK